jgi:hypothetical protein
MSDVDGSGFCDDNNHRYTFRVIKPSRENKLQRKALLGKMLLE